MRSIASTALSGSTGARLTSIAYPASQLSQAAITIGITGTTSVLGNVSLEVSYQQANTFPITLFQPTEWFSMPEASVAVYGNGTYALPMTSFSGAWVRVVYEPIVPDLNGAIVADLSMFGSSSSGSTVGNARVKVSVINNVGTGSNFSATAGEPLIAGMFAARSPDGISVIRADATDLNRMPAVGMVTEVKSDGSVMMQAHGPVASIIPATSDKLLFVGANGFPVGNAIGLKYVQPVGVWGESDTLILSITPTMTVKA